MELYKVHEKEMKQGSNLTPIDESASLPNTDSSVPWINGLVHTLETRIANLSSEFSSKKKKKRRKSSDATEVESIIANHTDHITSLMEILSSIESGEIDPSQVFS